MRTGRLITAVTVAIVVAGLAGSAVSGAATTGRAAEVSGGGPPGGGCQPAWHVVAAPRPQDAIPPVASGSEGQLVSVNAISRDHVLFSGYQNYNYSAGGIGQPWTLNWNGRSVAQTAPVPELPFTEPSFTDLAYDPSSYDSAADGWMLVDPLYANNYIEPDVSFAERWHDGQWTMTPMAVSPDVRAKGIWLQDVVARSPSDAWAAGALYAVGPGNLFGADPVGALIEHWNGSQWNIVPNPAGGQAGGVLHGLTVVSPDDIWAVGQRTDGTGGTLLPLIEHWDGTAWRLITAPAGRPSSWLQAVSADGARDAWAVGYQAAAGHPGTYVPLIEHWDGTAWSAATLPDGGAGLSGLASVYTASAGDVWATFGGSQYLEGSAADGQTQAFLHWDGRRWTTVPEPGPREFGVSYAYHGIGGTGPDDVWAAGEADVSYPGYIAPLIAHLSCG